MAYSALDLLTEHRRLDGIVVRLQGDRYADTGEIARLKKSKLQIRDRLARLAR